MRRALALLAVGLVGCSPSVVDTAAWPPPPENARSGLSVVDLTATRVDGGGLAVEIVTQGSAERARLACRVRRGDAVVAEAAVDFAPAGTTLTRFQLARDGGWPAGAYRFDVDVDGRAVTSRELRLE